MEDATVDAPGERIVGEDPALDPGRGPRYQGGAGAQEGLGVARTAQAAATVVAGHLVSVGIGAGLYGVVSAGLGCEEIRQI